MAKQVGVIELHLDEGAVHDMVRAWVKVRFPYLEAYEVVNLSWMTLKLTIREIQDGQVEGQNVGDQPGQRQPQGARRAARTP